MSKQLEFEFMNDEVNHPSHYKVGGLETWEILVAKLTPEELKGYCKACIIKYITRAELKGGKKDYLKAQWYMNKLVELKNDKNS